MHGYGVGVDDYATRIAYTPFVRVYSRKNDHPLSVCQLQPEMEIAEFSRLMENYHQPLAFAKSNAVTLAGKTPEGYDQMAWVADYCAQQRKRWAVRLYEPYDLVNGGYEFYFDDCDMAIYFKLKFS